MEKTELRELLKKNNYTWIGIRGTKKSLNVGEILDTSYRWDHVKDQSSLVELGGVCATGATTANWAHFYREDDDIEDMIELIQERIKYHKSYCFNYNYIIASNSRNPYNFEENDLHEMILENAIVIAEIK